MQYIGASLKENQQHDVIILFLLSKDKNYLLSLYWLKQRSQCKRYVLLKLFIDSNDIIYIHHTNTFIIKDKIVLISHPQCHHYRKKTMFLSTWNLFTLIRIRWNNRRDALLFISISNHNFRLKLTTWTSRIETFLPLFFNWTMWIHFLQLAILIALSIETILVSIKIFPIQVERSSLVVPLSPEREKRELKKLNIINFSRFNSNHNSTNFNIPVKIITLSNKIKTRLFRVFFRVFFVQVHNI